MTEGGFALELNQESVLQKPIISLEKEEPPSYYRVYEPFYPILIKSRINWSIFNLIFSLIMFIVEITICIWLLCLNRFYYKDSLWQIKILSSLLASIFSLVFSMLALFYSSLTERKIEENKLATSYKYSRVSFKFNIISLIISIFYVILFIFSIIKRFF